MLLLECNVFGELINDETIDSIVNKYYNSKNVSFRRSGESDRVYDGNLKDYYRVYKNQQPQTTLDLVLDGVTYGTAEIYFDLKRKKPFAYSQESLLNNNEMNYIIQYKYQNENSPHLH